MMEDSGFDSDAKTMQNENGRLSPQSDTDLVAGGEHLSLNSSQKSQVSKPTDLQKKLERQREAAAKKSAEKKSLLSRTRLLVPTKPRSMTDPNSSAPDAQPLVLLQDSDDDSDDEFAMPRLSRQAQREITAQLIKDGYNLDLQPDDDDLDLIPPRPVSQRCACCPHAYVNANLPASCTIL